MRTAKTLIRLGGARLIWVFSGRTGHFVGFIMHRFICNLGESNERARFGLLLESLRFFFFFFLSTFNYLYLFITI